MVYVKLWLNKDRRGLATSRLLPQCHLKWEKQEWQKDAGSWQPVVKTWQGKKGVGILYGSTWRAGDYEVPSASAAASASTSAATSKSRPQVSPALGTLADAVKAKTYPAERWTGQDCTVKKFNKELTNWTDDDLAWLNQMKSFLQRISSKDEQEADLALTKAEREEYERYECSERQAMQSERDNQKKDDYTLFWHMQESMRKDFSSNDTVSEISQRRLGQKVPTRNECVPLTRSGTDFKKFFNDLPDKLPKAKNHRLYGFDQPMWLADSPGDFMQTLVYRGTMHHNQPGSFLFQSRQRVVIHRPGNRTANGQRQNHHPQHPPVSSNLAATR